MLELKNKKHNKIVHYEYGKISETNLNENEKERNLTFEETHRN